MKTICLSSCFFLAIIGISHAQGITNYGAYITSNSTSYLVLSENSSLIFEDYLGGPGAIVLNGNTIITGDLTNNSSSATLASSGTGVISFDGTSQQEIGGDNTLQLKSIDLKNDLILGNGLIITSNLNFTDGVFDLSDFDLTIADGGSLTGSSSTNFVKVEDLGNLIRYAISSGSSILFPVGTSTSYTPVSISLTSGTSQYFNVRLMDGVWSDGTSGDNLALIDPVVNRTWIIHSDQVHDVILALQWNATDEVNGFDRTTAFMNVYDDQWTSTSAVVSGSDPYQVTYSGVTNLTTSNVHAINDVESPLSIDLLNFDGVVNDLFNHIYWSTAREQNADFFMLSKSKDNINFTEVATAKASGNSSSITNYKFDDYDISNGNTYYKIEEHDFNGDISMYASIVLYRSSSNLTL